MNLLSRARTAGLAVFAGVALALAPSLTASAHVSVSSADAAPGGSGTLVFRVPSESSTASTTALTIVLPTDTPFRSVRAASMPGWTVSIERTALGEPVQIGDVEVTEVISSVTWTADGPGVAPDEFAEFKLRVGPFPEEGGTFAFPATQTYSDGEVVAWSDPVAEGGDEPEHPAPTLDVRTELEAVASDAADASDSTARVLGIVGIGVGVLGFGGGLALGRRPPRRSE